MAKLIVSWFRIFPVTFFCLSALGMYYNPLFYIFLGLSLTSSIIYIFTHEWAEKVAPSLTPFTDYFWRLYERSLKTLEEHNK